VSDFNFDNYREHQKSYKTFFRFVIYIGIIIVLLYLILNRSNKSETIPNREIDSIEEVEIELNIKTLPQINGLILF